MSAAPPSEVPSTSTFDLLQEAVLVLDPALRIVAANPACEAVFGVAPAKIVGDDVGTWVLGADTLDSQRPQTRRSATGAELGQIWELHAQHAEGKTFTVAVTQADWPDPPGSTVLVVRDLTDRHKVIQRLTRANERLNAAKEAAIDQSRAKTITLARLAQVLRTPLSTIMGYGELLLEEAEERGLDDLVPDLERIVRSGSTLSGILKNVVDFAEIEAGRMRVVQRPVKVADEVSGAVAFAEPLAELGENTIRTELTNAGDAWADPERVGQILRNILHNACRFTEKGTITVRVTREVGLDDSHVIAIAIEDTGVGMDDEQLAELFVEYGRRGNVREAAGTGISLVVSHALAHLMGGTLTAHSEPEAGSVFTLRLPAMAVQSEALPPMMAETPSPLPRRVEQPRVRVAVPDPVLRSRVLASIERGDWPVRETALGPDTASELAHESTLIVVGYDTGRDLLTELDEAGATAPVLLVAVPADRAAQNLASRVTGLVWLDPSASDDLLDIALHEAVSRAVLVGAMTRFLARRYS